MNALEADPKHDLTPELRAALGIQCFVALAAPIYWGLWYGGGRALVATASTESYIAFENAFLLADTWLVLACLLGIRALVLRRAVALWWITTASSSSIFLGLMDVCFNLENGIYTRSTGPALAIELVLNACALGFGVYGLWLGRKHHREPEARHLLSG